MPQCTIVDTAGHSCGNRATLSVRLGFQRNHPAWTWDSSLEIMEFSCRTHLPLALVEEHPRPKPEGIAEYGWIIKKLHDV